ncbi:uncharacterized protein G2W53_007588 [Senna tora]|uniref:Uncharacterized protein n=1 Tax=Senna tora TaxID=362788 RepID=A0A834X6F2_9FABA|nr:uncharacterized protein G2W53_007588 [Senna tora]
MASLTSGESADSFGGGRRRLWRQEVVVCVLGFSLKVRVMGILGEEGLRKKKKREVEGLS